MPILDRLLSVTGALEPVPVKYDRFAVVDHLVSAPANAGDPVIPAMPRILGRPHSRAMTEMG